MVGQRRARMRDQSLQATLGQERSPTPQASHSPNPPGIRRLRGERGPAHAKAPQIALGGFLTPIVQETREQDEQTGAPRHRAGNLRAGLFATAKLVNIGRYSANLRFGQT